MFQRTDIAFEAEGFLVSTYCDGQSAFEELALAPADLGIFGRSMPKLSGPDLFRQLRKITAMPVIFLSSYAAELTEEIQGADDYLPTGCSQRLLVDRAHAVLRLHRRDGLIVDSTSCSCSWRQQRVYLNMPEFLIIEAIARNGICTRIALMEAAYGPSIEMDEALIDGHVAAMRRKFQQIDGSIEVIEIVCGVAYRLSKWAR